MCWVISRSRKPPRRFRRCWSTWNDERIRAAAGGGARRSRCDLHGNVRVRPRRVRQIRDRICGYPDCDRPGTGERRRRPDRGGGDSDPLLMNVDRPRALFCGAHLGPNHDVQPDAMQHRAIRYPATIDGFGVHICVNSSRIPLWWSESMK